MSNLFWPNIELMAREGYASIAGVPVLFDDNWAYCAEANWYLRQRARLEWTPSATGKVRLTAAGLCYPTSRTLEHYARCLGDFFDWLAHSGVDWHEVDYTRHLVEGYQADMRETRWGTTGKALSPSTVNARIAEACHFLRWAGERGLRPPFQMVVADVAVKRPSGRNSHGHRAVFVQARAGAQRQSPKALRLPTAAETNRWLASVKAGKGVTKALMCELILETAIRLTEAAEWRVDTLPLDPKDWRIIGDSVQVTVKYGAKGPKYPDGQGAEHGPPRLIFVPLAIAQRLHEYRETKRLTALAKWVKSAPTAAERTRRQGHPPVRLFLSEYSGIPVSRGALYEAWTEVPQQPFSGWSPHGGRHLWACRKLLAGIERNAHLAGRTADAMPGDWVTSMAQTDIDIVIRPQLGHVDKETTLRYLQWVTAAAVMPAMADSYLRLLEGTDG